MNWYFCGAAVSYLVFWLLYGALPAVAPALLWPFGVGALVGS